MTSFPASFIAFSCDVLFPLSWLRMVRAGIGGRTGCVVSAVITLGKSIPISSTCRAVTVCALTSWRLSQIVKSGSVDLPGQKTHRHRC